MTEAGFAGTQAVLFDRDGTLVVDVPYNADPDRVQPMPTAIPALRLLRSFGLLAGIVTNQSGVARGLISDHDIGRVNQRVDELFGGFDVWCVCPHSPDDQCRCRKPQPGLILRAAERLGLTPAQVVVIGDIGSDVDAAAAAGARSILVPTAHTRFGEILEAPVVAPDLLSAVDELLTHLQPRGQR
jgi:D-glycero-D-manno-heptose 1,7-bisphosphate phosphatase